MCRRPATAARLDALVAPGGCRADLATDLVDSLHFLMGLQAEGRAGRAGHGRAVSGAVRTERLGSLERDLLKDALAVVKRFKALVRHQFHLEVA